ncbi:heme exporter protein CcmD [Algirhabdus cladophorae]
MIDLGKYASDVLLAYGVTLVLMFGLIALSWAASRRTKARLEALERDTDG